MSTTLKLMPSLTVLIFRQHKLFYHENYEKGEYLMT